MQTGRFCRLFRSFELMKLPFFISLLFFTLNALAQQPVVEISNPSRLPPKTGKFRIMGKNNDGIVVRLFGADEDVVDVYDEQLKLVTAKDIEFKNQVGLSQYMILNKNGAVIFYLWQDKKYSVLYAQPVNSKFIEEGKPIVIDTIYDRRDLVAANLRYKSSFDQSKLLIYYPYFTGQRITSIKFIGIEHSLQMLYNKTIPFNHDEKDLEESRSFIDNNGNCYFIIKTSEEPAGAVYSVSRIGTDGNFTTFNIASQKTLFGEADFDVDNKNGTLVMCAFYNDLKSSGEQVANGFMYAVFDPVKGTRLKANYTLFPKDFLQTLTGRQWTDEGKLYTFTIKKTELRNDGGILIIAESLIKDSREIPNNVGIQPGFNTYRTSVLYQFNDIIAFSLNPEGQIDWHAVLRKKQASEDDNGVYSSFMVVNEKDKLHLIYLDDVTTTGVLNEYVLSSDGKNSRIPILNQEDKDVMLLPKMGRQISPNQAVIPSFKNNELRLVKITF